MTKLICLTKSCRNRDKNGNCTWDEIRIVDLEGEGTAICEGYEPVEEKEEKKND